MVKSYSDTQKDSAPEGQLSQNPLAFMLDLLPGAWFFTRRDGTFWFVSLGACEALGYTRQELLALTVFDLDSAVDREMWEGLWATTKLNDMRTIRARHRRKDGSEYPIEIRSLRVQFNGEEFAAAHTIDLTASEETRAALRATESRLQRLLNNLRDLVFRVRLLPEPCFEFLSPSSLELLGYQPHELMGAADGVQRVLHPDDVSKFLAMHRTPPGQGLELRFRHASGKVVWMDLRTTRVDSEDGRQTVLEGVARDVTQAHEAQASHQRLLAAIEQAAEAVVVTDARGLVEYVNPAYLATSGLSEGDVLGRPWNELEVHADRTFLHALERVIAGEQSWQGRIRCRRANGQAYSEDATVAPLRDGDGSLVGCVAVKRDITEQLALESQLHQAQKMEAVGQLAGGIAHDFNNLLHIILGHTQMAQMLSPEDRFDGKELREMLGEIDRASERAASLVRQLLAFSRKGSPEFSQVMLDEVVSSLHGMLQRLLGHHIQLMLTCELSPAPVRGNAAQLEQVITNLCLNARDALRPGGYLSVSLRQAHHSDLPAAFRERAMGEYAQLTVRDDGNGMTPEVQRRLYEPFFTTKQPGVGTGLGLATVYAVVQAHGGFIDVDSAPGEGSTFRVFLPLMRVVDEPSRPPTSSRGINGEGRLALVAEDEPAVLELTASYLRQSGFTVVTATSGPEAEAVLRERGPEVAIAVLDAVMPGFGGQGVHQAMRDQGLSAPVLFVTGYDYETLADATGLGSVSILRKPFGPSELLHEVGLLLRARM